MTDHPKAGELIEAVALFLDSRVAHKLEGRDAFLAKVAANALAAVKRELDLGAGARAAAHRRLIALIGREAGFADLNAAFCDQLRSGELTLRSPGVMAHLKASTIDQVRIDQPNYSGLKRYIEEIG